MRKAVYLFLLALLLLLELVTVEGKCIGSKCSSMTRCATLCNKCTSTTSCRVAQSACNSAKEAVKCVPPSSSSSSASKCKYDCSKCTSTAQCRSVVARCKRYGITSCKPRSSSAAIKCRSDCSKCTSIGSCNAVVSRCKRYGVTSCKPRSSSSKCKYDCSKCTSTRSCSAVVARCKRYGITSCKPKSRYSSLCYSKCRKCKLLRGKSGYGQCMRDARKYCKGSCPVSTSKGMADIFDMDWDETDEIVGVEPIESTNGLIAFKVTKPAIISVAVVIFLLVINISCLCYNKCIKNRKDKKIMYAKVAAIASSDDDMENLKRVQI